MANREKQADRGIKIDVQEITAQNAHRLEWFHKKNSLDTDVQ